MYISYDRGNEMFTTLAYVQEARSPDDLGPPAENGPISCCMKRIRVRTRGYITKTVLAVQVYLVHWMMLS